jgi:arylsulfatase A-like enzyme
VVERLVAADFGVEGPPHARAVARIGEEARAVVVAPARVPVALGLGLRPQGGEIRLAAALPEAVRRLPASSFAVAVQRFALRAPQPASTLEEWSRSRFWRQLERGWRLERDARDPARATLVYTPAPEDLVDRAGDVYMSLRLEGLLPPPVALESRAFDVPRAGHLELAYGVESPEAGEERPPVRFSARLACEGAAPVDLLSRTIDPASPGDSGWHEERVELPSGPRSCRLALRAEATSGDPIGSLWAVPRILARDPAAADRRSVVLISLDTLRADHLSGYGYPRATSPRIDVDLIARGTTFADVSATFPLTDVSHLSLFTSLYSEAQPALGRLPDSSPLPLLGERLRAAGFETAAFTEDALLAGSFGLWFGFDRFVERAFLEHDRGEQTFADGARYLREHRERRFFLFLHTYKTHAPYVASERYQGLFAGLDEPGPAQIAPRVHPRYRDELDAYDRAIREADDLVGGLLAELRALGLEERTIVVLLSDHGESFGEHVGPGHGWSGHQEQLAVPLVLRGPGIPAGLRVETPVSLVDVAPTLLDLLGVDGLPAAQGISLAPALRGEPLPQGRALFFAWLRAGSGGVRRGARKYVHVAGEPAGLAFDLDADPGEQRPVAGPAPPQSLAGGLLAKHRDRSARLRAEAAAGAPAAEGTLTEEVERSLRALGYLE